MSSLSSSPFPALFNDSSSSTGLSDDPVSLDSTEYPTVFLLAIFLPALAVGAVFVYLHYAMRHWGELRWPWNAPGGKRRRRMAVTPPAGSGGVNLVAELRHELSGVSGGGGPNDSFIGSDSLAGHDRPASHAAMHRPLLADNIF